MENKHISAGRWKCIFREKILKPAGIWVAPSPGKTRPKFSSYTLRHTTATELMDVVKDPRFVQRFLGHSDIRSTMIYTHLSKDFQEVMRQFLNQR
jgi:site-specific recombinase XerD